MRGTIVPHLADLDAAAAAAAASIGAIKVMLAADHLAPGLPPTWLGRTLSAPVVFVDVEALLSEWPS